MPRFHFNLRDCHCVRLDPDGTLLADVDAARSYGTRVAGELMRNRERGTRYWSLEVCDAARELLFEIDFAKLDHTLDHWPPQVRESVLRLGEAFRGLAKTIADCRMTVLESKALLAQADRKPYVIAQDGRRIEL